jgi:hypothetical protein
MQVDVNDANKGLCMCPTCPSFDSCMRGAGELLYCGSGKSSCEVGANGCLCPDCAVHENYALKHNYFCISGAAS